MKNGIYGLISLSGTALSAADCATLGLFKDRPMSHDSKECQFAVRLQDSSGESTDSDLFNQDNLSLAFLGYLDNRLALANALDLDAHMPVAALILAAFDRWGAGACARLHGEWSLLLFDRARRQLRLATSETLRDQMYFARGAACVAVAPQLSLLAHLPWVGREYDPVGLICSMSRWAYRSLRDGRTLLRNVTAVECGTEHRVEVSSHRHSPYARIPEVTPWVGTYQDALAELDETARNVLRRQLSRHRNVAVMLSGGLDSSLLSLLASQERKPHQKVFAISSVAPPDGNLPDEREFMEVVARELGLAIFYVSPPEYPSVYRPGAHVFAYVEEPVTVQRHYLYEALYCAALREGATAVLDGTFGELALTRTVPLSTVRGHLRAIPGKLRARIDSRINPPRWPDDGLHVKLSKSAQSLLVDAFGSSSRAPPSISFALRPDAPLGFAVGYLKSGKVPTDTWHPSLRQLYPYRDRSLVQFAARLPAKYSVALGPPRSLARALIGRNLPARISMRVSKHPFAPDYRLRLRGQALAAARRLAVHRESGAMQWLDLDWAAAELMALHAGEARSAQALSKVQCTVIAAEFFTWWEEEARIANGAPEPSDMIAIGDSAIAQDAGIVCRS